MKPRRPILAPKPPPTEALAAARLILPTTRSPKRGGSRSFANNATPTNTSSMKGSGLCPGGVRSLGPGMWSAGAARASSSTACVRPSSHSIRFAVPRPAWLATHNRSHESRPSPVRDRVDRETRFGHRPDSGILETHPTPSPGAFFHCLPRSSAHTVGSVWMWATGKTILEDHRLLRFCMSNRNDSGSESGTASDTAAGRSAPAR